MFGMGAMITAIGLMSGTSLDGVDVAVLVTDGDREAHQRYAKTFPYPDALRSKLKQCLNQKDDSNPLLQEAEEEMTRFHAKACREALDMFPDVSLIGFHGQTIWHAPEEGRTRQLGNGALLAHLTGREVVYDFRSNDMRHGGQGAPLMPLFHAQRAAGLPRPLAIVNIGGVSNVTWVGEKPDEIVAFDTGPGNALLNDWMELKTGEPMDRGGNCAAKGVVNKQWVRQQLLNPYLRKMPPKSLDRNAFSIEGMDRDFSLADGAATLTHLTAACIVLGQKYFPKSPRLMVITGGGRHNKTMMNEIKKMLNPGTQLVSAEALDWNGDILEAKGFGYLAVRAKRGWPLTLPQTTGCDAPCSGGVIVEPDPDAVSFA